MTIDELAAVLRVHQGPFFNGTHSRCGCRRIVQTADEWARHVAEEIKAVETSPVGIVVEAGLMTDVPPCSCGKSTHGSCVHHGQRWLRIRRNLARTAGTVRDYPSETTEHVEFRYHGDELDEFVAKGCDVHFECMGTGSWWMRITAPDGNDYHVNIGVDPGKPLPDDADTDDWRDEQLHNYAYHEADQ